MEFFVTLVNAWKPPTNATKGFILDVAMGFFRCVLVKQLLKLIKDGLKLIVSSHISLISTFNNRDP